MKHKPHGKCCHGSQVKITLCTEMYTVTTFLCTSVTMIYRLNCLFEKQRHLLFNRMSHWFKWNTFHQKFIEAAVIRSYLLGRRWKFNILKYAIQTLWCNHCKMTYFLFTGKVTVHLQYIAFTKHFLFSFTRLTKLLKTYCTENKHFYTANSLIGITVNICILFSNMQQKIEASINFGKKLEKRWKDHIWNDLFVKVYTKLKYCIPLF